MSMLRVNWINSEDPTDRGQQTLPLPITIGRAPDNDIVLPILSTGVSRKHAVIRQAVDGIVLSDLRSTNGTFMGGVRISEQRITETEPFIIGSYLVWVKGQVRCQEASCRELIDHNDTMCPWCGRFAADADLAAEPINVAEVEAHV